MTIPPPQPEPRADIIDALRAAAAGGAGVRELVNEVVTRLNIQKLDHMVIPVLWYFKRAFCLPLPVVLPIREWLGTDNDEEIDALILPAIERNRAAWENGALPTNRFVQSVAAVTAQGEA